MKKSNTDILFSSIGFGFPESMEEKTSFELIYTNFEFKSDVNILDPQKILERKNTAKIKVTNVDYHKRTVLAAEIVYELKEEWTLGHLKLQKLLYLCQNVANMSIHANFSKQALGPYDPRLMRSLDKKFKENKWFEFDKDGKPKYKTLEKAGEHKEWYERYYQNYISQVGFLINTFRKTNTNDIELIATVHACWSELLKNGEEISEKAIVEKVYSWSVEKQKFTVKSITDATTRIKELGINPQ